MADDTVYTLEKLTHRARGQREWLEKNHPNVFIEQKHTQFGTQEKAYWHYGYQAALWDVLLRMVEQEREKFEAWARRKLFDLTRTTAAATWDYRSVRTDAAWEAWKGAKGL